MSVQLRTKKLANGKQSFYLDIWNPYSQKRQYKFLKMYTEKARTPEQAEKNKEAKRLAENIRAKEEQNLQGREYNYVPAFKSKTNFIEYYEKFEKDYKNSDIRLVKCSLNKLKDFVKENDNKYSDGITLRDITEDFCIDFKKYLKSKLNGETPYNYFKKFKAVISKAVKDRLLTENYAANIENKRSSGLKKDILSIDELQLLFNAGCGNEEVKRAFIFCNYTGLRFCDVKILKWKSIDLVNSKIKIVQQKVKDKSSAYLTNDLPATALKVLGIKGNSNDLVFTLPSHTACNKDLKVWVKNAGINKKITWHCSRHSFAVNQLVYGADVKTVASNLGHSDIDTVEIYLRVVDELKKKAVNNIPELSLNVN